MALFPGNPFAVPPITTFTGVGTGAGPGTATTAQADFKAAAGATVRNITWDGVALNGTDFGGGANTTVINQNQTVGIPRNRFQGVGAFFEEVYAVSGDGFVDVNPSVTGLFPAFTPNNTFAMFNDNTIDMSFVLPSAVTPPATANTPVPAATRGFGAIFINVQGPGSKIDYFSGDRLLSSIPVPAGTQGQPEYVGALFPDAVVTRVVLTLGTDVLFSFNGVTATPGPQANNPPAHNLVVTDDFNFADPVSITSVPPAFSGAQGTQGAQPVVNATLGQPFNGTVATFSDTVAAAVARNFTAFVNWGDGHVTNGLVVANNAGGFDVRVADTPNNNTNTYTRSGRFPISVDVQKFDGTDIALTNTALVAQSNTTTTLAVDPITSIVGQEVRLTATVAAAQRATIPTGSVTFKDGDTILDVVRLDNAGKAELRTSRLTPGTHVLTAVFNGDADFNTSTSAPVPALVRSDVSSQIRFTLGPIRRRRGRFTQHVDLVNTGDALPGPLVFVLGGLSSRVRLLNASGVSTIQSPGSPFINLTLGPNNRFLPNATVGVDLLFTARNARAIRYNPRVFAGPGPV